MTFSISSLLSPLHPYKPSTAFRSSYGSLGMIPGLIWKMSCINLYVWNNALVCDTVTIPCIQLYETTPWYVIWSLYPVYSCMKQHHERSSSLYTVTSLYKSGVFVFQPSFPMIVFIFDHIIWYWAYLRKTIQETRHAYWMW